MNNHFENLKNNPIKKAHNLANIAHWFQTRNSGEQYFKDHSVKVADLIFKKWQEDENFEKINSEIAEKIEIAAYLHDTVEDTKIKLEDIERNFGEEMKMIIDSLSENKQKRKELEESGLSKNEIKKEMLKESLAKIDSLKNSEYSDAWEIAATIRIADILHNISDIEELDEEHKIRNLKKAKIIFEEFNGQIDLAETLRKRIEEIEER